MQPEIKGTIRTQCVKCGKRFIVRVEEDAPFEAILEAQKYLGYKAQHCTHFNCDICEDTGYVTKDEWTDTDTSYEVTKRCVCLED